MLTAAVLITLLALLLSWGLCIAAKDSADKRNQERLIRTGRERE